MSDELRRRLRGGDHGALGELLERHWRPLRHYLAGLLGDSDLADDVAQHAFVRLWQTRGRLRDEGSLEALLYRIARNAARDHLRRQRTRDALVVAPPPAAAGDPAELSELRRAVARAVAALPARRREVFLLLRTSDLTHREAGDLLGIAPQTVSNLMSRALDDLREALAPYL